MSDYAPSLTALKLYKRTSKRTGNEYLYGRWGALKVVVLKSNETTDDGCEIFNLILQQAEDKPRQPDSKPSRQDRAKANDPPPERRASRPTPNDEIPF